ncbi:hypothetical protein GCM10009020_34720 [Natronoarchaeum mannanilyticum]|uniref:EthD domain-containing protein n=2 Tax=Natronoarchaeum mannanilyticum TaxID=926360 RepID=A0AAV3TEL4_9EURY
MSHEEFVEYWQNNHTPIAKDIEGVVRYQQVLPTEPEHAEFDGLAELYFETLEDLYEALGSPGSRDYDPTKEIAAEARDDVDNFLAVEERPRIIGEEIVQKDEVDGDTDGLYKHSAFLVRQDDMTHEEFIDHWQNNHTPIAREIEGVVKYNTVIPTDPENAEFDGVAELYFEDLDKLYRALGSEGSRDYDAPGGKAKEAREDVDNFLAIDERPRFIGWERLVKDQG